MTKSLKVEAAAPLAYLGVIPALERTKFKGMMGLSSRTADRVLVTHTVRPVEPGSNPRHLDAKYAADFTVELKPGLPTGPLNGRFTIECNFPFESKMHFNTVIHVTAHSVNRAKCS